MPAVRKAPIDADYGDGKRMLPRILLAILLVLLVLVGIAFTRIWPDAVPHLLDEAGRLQRALGAAGWLLAALVQVLISLSGVLPASVGALAAGLLYGVAGGFMLSAFGTLVGAGLAFMLTRSLFRPLIMRTLARHGRLLRLDQAVAKDGWRLVCLLRISPVMPFAVTSYALGLTSLDFRSYALGSLASLPALLGYVVLGHLSGSGLSGLAGHDRGWLHWSFLALSVAATLLLILKLNRILRQVMRLPNSSQILSE